MSPRDSGEFASGPPRRWLDDPEGTTDLERGVLQSGVDMNPPPGADRAIFAALVAKLGPAAGGGGGAPPSPGPTVPPAAPSAGGAAAKGAATAASAAASGGGLVASSLIGAACAIAVLGGASLLEDRGRPKSPPPAPAAEVASPPKPVEPAARAAAPAHVPIAADAPSPRPEASAATAAKPGEGAAAKLADPASPRSNEPAADAPSLGVANADPGGTPGPSLGAGDPAALADRASRLREESQMLSQAREALHAGDVAKCFALLETARTRFSGGILGQEREALTIEALAQSGNRALAAQRAAAFLAAYPTSPHAARVRTFAQ